MTASLSEIYDKLGTDRLYFIERPRGGDDGGGKRNSKENDYQPRICLQCQKCPPSEVCPSGVFQWDKATGVVRVTGEACDGCGLCVLECPLSSLFEENERILVCNLCEGKPKCVEVCHKQAIVFT